MMKFAEAPPRAKKSEKRVSANQGGFANRGNEGFNIELMGVCFVLGACDLRRS